MRETPEVGVAPVESMAQHSVRVVLENRIVLPARSLLVNDARFTMRREE